MIKQKAENKEDLGVVRILSKDVEGKLNVSVGLTKIKGISWSFSNAICKKLKIDKMRKMGSLSERELAGITEFIKNPVLPKFILNRRNDYSSGEDKHFTGTDLDLQKEFDIKRLKKIKSYRGLRHMAGQPVRGQRTKSHFREKNRKAVGVRKNPNAKTK